MNNTNKIEAGSEPMESKRLEKFAQILAEQDGGISLVKAWCQSDPAEVKPEPSNGRRVSSSNAMKRVAGRVAWLKQKNASTAPVESLTAERLSVLMEETTASLMAAARHAQKAGANNIAQQLRKTLTIHAGRSSRLEQRVPPQDKTSDVLDVDSILSRLTPCTCPEGIC